MSPGATGSGAKLKDFPSAPCVIDADGIIQYAHVSPKLQHVRISTSCSQSWTDLRPRQGRLMEHSMYASTSSVFRPPPHAGDVVVYGSRWRGITMMVRRHLDRAGVPYTSWIGRHIRKRKVSSNGWPADGLQSNRHDRRASAGAAFVARTRLAFDPRRLSLTATNGS